MSTDPRRSPLGEGGPLLYFGGRPSRCARTAAKRCDVFLMWPDKEELLGETIIADMNERAPKHRPHDATSAIASHVIVRETEAEARAAAERLVSKLDDRSAAEIGQVARRLALAGVARQGGAARAGADDGYVEPHMWTGIGRARSGCGSGDRRRSRSGAGEDAKAIGHGDRGVHPLGLSPSDEADLFAHYVLPRLKTCKLAEVQGRSIPNPITPLTTGPRK